MYGWCPWGALAHLGSKCLGIELYELHLLWELDFADSFIEDTALGSKLCL